MPSHNEPVQPTHFEVANETAAVSTPPPAQPPARRWIVPTLGLLLVLAMLVVFWLPGKLNLTAQETTAPSPAPAPAQAIAMPETEDILSAPVTEEKSPWSDAQQARLRLAAQDVLAELLDLQFSLEEQGVKNWEPGTYADAAALANEGDVLYRRQAYDEASEKYRQSLSLLQGVAEDKPRRLQSALDTAAQAIQRGDIEEAGTAVKLAAALHGTAGRNDELALLQQRLQSLPDLLQLLAQARRKEQAGELREAVELLTQASSRDPLHRGAAQALDRVRSALEERNFQDSMSSGYTLLHDGKFDAARKAFTRAAELKPGSAEAASAIREADTLAAGSKLADLKTQGATQERREQWQSAVQTYTRALQVDPSVLFAAEGLARSQERASLDEQFREIIENPDRLSEIKVAVQASDFLRHMRTVSPQGKVLLSQISELETLLRDASTPIAVTLHSDLQTDVVLHRVAQLGKFRQQELKLRPGTYTAVGTRLGYRDVRRQFTVRHDGSRDPITVICTEAI